MTDSLDYSRIDGALALACEEASPNDPCLSVFVHVAAPPDDDQASILTKHGVRLPSKRSRILTANLSPSQVAALSNEPWIVQMRLSRPLKMSGD